MKQVKVLISSNRIDEYEGDSKYSYNNCATVVYLQTDDDKHIIFDTGAFGYEQKLINALAEINLAPKDIDFVFLSHAHFDHNANIHLFKNAKLIYHKWIVNIKNGDSKLFGKEYRNIPQTGIDEIEIVKTAGHTGDSISIFFKFKNKTYGLVGDAIKLKQFENNTRISASNPEIHLKTTKMILSKADIIITGDDGLIDEDRVKKLKLLLKAKK